MKGTNKLVLNTATMIEALQLWLESQMKDQVPTVTGLDLDDNDADMFVVCVSSDADKGKSSPAV